MEYAVGCSECHTMNFEKHKDTFAHNGYDVHIVVTPLDCATCHSKEASQFSQNLMSHAHVNLTQNSLYRDLMESINGTFSFAETELSTKPGNAETDADSCLFCHGTRVEVRGSISKETEMGEMSFPVLSGWPNQGVGRINPDGSQGSCAACHTRHQFAIEMARKPYTCSQCHKGPDVPAYKVYSVSKHGNIYDSLNKDWDLKRVPWTVGKDFTAPTCAGCHMSLLVDEEGTLIAERSHQVSDRLPWRLFGLIYAHPHPRSPDLTNIKNKAGLPLPTELSGEPVSEFLIDGEEQLKRQKVMQRICLGCHGESWVNGHWTRLENTIKTSNEMTLAATQILDTAWSRGLAKGLAQNDSVFNEAIERMWVEQWLFFANSTRLSSAMGGADYGVFEQGRWNLSKNVIDMMDWLELHSAMKKRGE
jgi:hydroxylamine dehydrogenase